MKSRKIAGSLGLQPAHFSTEISQLGAEVMNLLLKGHDLFEVSTATPLAG